jgi:hypothetical protein
MNQKEGEKLRAPSTVWFKPAFEQLIVLSGDAYWLAEVSTWPNQGNTGPLFRH